MSRAYIEFFERHVPMLIRASWSVVGGVAMLCYYDGGLLPWCVALLVPALLLNTFYGRKTFLLSGRLHDQLECEVDVIRDASAAEVRDLPGRAAPALDADAGVARELRLQRAHVRLQRGARRAVRFALDARADLRQLVTDVFELPGWADGGRARAS